MTDVWIMRVDWIIPRELIELAAGTRAFTSPAWRRLAEIWTERCVEHRKRDAMGFVKRYDEQRVVEKEALQDVYRWAGIKDLRAAGLLLWARISPPNTSHDGLSSRNYQIQMAIMAGQNRETARGLALCMVQHAANLRILGRAYEHRMDEKEDPTTFCEVQEHPTTGYVLRELDTGWELDPDYLMIQVEADEMENEGWSL